MRNPHDELTFILQHRLTPGWSADTFTSYDGQSSLVLIPQDEQCASYVATLSSSGFSLAALTDDQLRPTHEGLSLDAMLVLLDRLTSSGTETNDRAA